MLPMTRSVWLLGGLILSVAITNAGAASAGGTQYSGSRPRVLVLAWDDGGATARALARPDWMRWSRPGRRSAAWSRSTPGWWCSAPTRSCPTQRPAASPPWSGAAAACWSSTPRKIPTSGGIPTAASTGRSPSLRPFGTCSPLPWCRSATRRRTASAIRLVPRGSCGRPAVRLLAGVDLTQAPVFPRHGFMVLPTHPLVQGTHLMFAWSEDQYKGPLWGNGQVLAWGDDPEQRPLLLCAEYGARPLRGRSRAAVRTGLSQVAGQQNADRQPGPLAAGG